MSYKEIKKKEHVIKEDYLVTLGKYQVLYLNKFLMYKYFRGIENVVLLFDDIRKRIAIKPITSPQKNSYRLTFTTKSQSTAAIIARSLIRKMKVDSSKKSQYKAIWNDRECFLEVLYESCL